MFLSTLSIQALRKQASTVEVTGELLLFLTNFLCGNNEAKSVIILIFELCFIFVGLHLGHVENRGLFEYTEINALRLIKHSSQVPSKS